jgi:hypothetical protein
MKRFMLAWLFLASFAHAATLEGGAGILYGPNYWFSLEAPAGWVLDNQSAVSQGLHAVFYPAGSSWADAPVVFYGNARGITPLEKTAEQMAHADIADFRASGSTDYAGHFVENWILREGRVAQIWKFEGDKRDSFEAIAYVAERKTINFIVMSAHTKKDRDAAWPQFRQLVLSYQYLGDDVRFETKKQSFPAPTRRSRDRSQGLSRARRRLG